MSNGVITLIVGNVQVAPPVGTTLELLQGTISITQQLNQSCSAGFTLRDLTAGLNRPTVGVQMSIAQDGVTLFVGFLQSFIEVEEQALNSCQYQCTCVDWSAVTDRRVITTTYTQGTILQNIAQDIVSNWLTGDGVTLATDLDGTTVLPSDMTFNPSMVRDALNQLCAACNRQWWIDNNKQLHFQIPGIHYGLAPNPFNIASNDRNWVDGSMQVTRTADNFRDQQFITTPNPIGTVSRKEVFTITGPLDFFLVTAFAITSAPTVTVNGVAQTVYQRGVDANNQNGWYWIQNGYGVEQGTQTTPANGSTVVVTYNALAINYVEYTSAALVAVRAAIEGTSGVWANIANLPQVNDPAVALAQAQGMVTLGGVIPQSVQFQTYRQDAVLGCQIFANIPERGLNGWFTVVGIAAQAIAGAQGVPSSNFSSGVGPAYGGVAKGVLFTITMNDAQAIGPFPLFFQQLVASIGGLATSGGGTAAQQNTPAQPSTGGTVLKGIVEEPAGTKNGVNTTFTISYSPLLPMFWLFLNGIEQSPFNQPSPETLPDYTLSGSTITFRVAPNANDEIFVEYFIALPGTTTIPAGDPYIVQKAPPAFVDMASASTSFAALPAIGDVILVVVQKGGTDSINNLTCTDNQGHTYTVVYDSNVNSGSRVFATVVTHSSGTFTVTGGGSSGGTNVFAYEVSGLGNPWTVDILGPFGSNNQTVPIGPTTGAHDFILVVAEDNNGPTGDVFTAVGCTLLDTQTTAGTHVGPGAVGFVVKPAGTYTVGFTRTSVAGQNTGAVAFKA